MTAAIRIENLGKRYRLHHNAERRGYRTLRESLVEMAASPIRRLRKDAAEGSQVADFWALRDVSFDVQPGDVVGVIGRNGAGKSTLLKIISRITRPTTGRITLHGRVGSLLEVGTGFHPELTGRENIFLNGSILGMSRIEIGRKFDEIVNFSGVEAFIDTPVKRYSSGMQVRLAFAVAAHLEPEILIVDEVLAVGDAEFQKKCLGKMQDIGRDGRTVFFVSHNLSALELLCHRGILLKEGRVVQNGPIDGAIRTYLDSIEDNASRSLLERTDRGGDGPLRLSDFACFGWDRQWFHLLIPGNPARFRISTNIPAPPGLSCILSVYDNHGQLVTKFDTRYPSLEDTHQTNSQQELICELEELLLVPGRYRINVALFAAGKLQDHVEGACIFDVQPGALRGRMLGENARGCSIILPHRWLLPTSD